MTYEIAIENIPEEKSKNNFPTLERKLLDN